MKRVEEIAQAQQDLMATVRADYDEISQRNKIRVVERQPRVDHAL